MKLTKVIDILGWYSDSVNDVEDVVKEARKQVTNWKEDAEHLRNLWKNEEDLRNKYQIIVQRLKKRIEELEAGDYGSWTFYYTTLRELQKILGEEK